MPSLIEDYALIGDCRGAALVAKDGSIDWLCVPRFDSAACCASLLGTNQHGYWKIAPTDPIRSVRRKYIEGTMVLETTMECDSGTIKLIDFMPPQTREPDVFRLIEGVEGEVQIATTLSLRFDYGSIRPRLRRTERGISAVAGPESMHCFTDMRMELDDDNAHSTFNIVAGQQIAFQLSWASTSAVRCITSADRER